MGIRKKTPRCNLASVPDAVEVTTYLPENVASGNEVRTRLVKKRVNVLSKDNRPVLPSHEEYKLSALLAAGVPLKEVATSRMLNPTDPADLESLGASATINILNNGNYSKIKQKPESSVEPNPNPQPEP